MTMKRNPLYLLIILLSIYFGYIGCKKVSNTDSPPTISLVKKAGFVWCDTTVSADIPILIHVSAAWNGADPLTNIEFIVNGESSQDGINQLHNFESDFQFVKSQDEYDSLTFIIRDRAGYQSSIAIRLNLQH